jgi:D-sedoheptulose 7-phosphate isomerase
MQVDISVRRNIASREIMMFAATLKHHIDCFGRLEALAPVVETVGEHLAAAIGRGRKILICGNGGSAADAQHFAAELIGRFEQERSAWPAIALTTDTSILTAIGNDYGYDDVFARQVQGLGGKGDILMGISTSGNSTNVVRAVEMARAAGMETVGLLGHDGGALNSLVDHSVVIDDPKTARIQEAHIFILHFWAMQIEQSMMMKLQYRRV